MATQQETAAQPALDEAKMEAFVEKTIGDYASTMTVTLAALGDRLGLFKALAENGPATSEALAKRAGLKERYVREWLRGMTSGGYLDYDRDSGQFELPPEHAPSLVQEGGPAFLGGGFQMIPSMIGVLDRIAESFQKGGGVKQDAYSADMWDGMQRFTDGYFENYLLQLWIPAMADVEQKLESGASVADVGCGTGRALIKLARAFPNSRFVGYDAFEGQIERAKANVKKAGLADQISFELLDVSKGLPEKYDVITTFDVIHDAVNPLGLLKAIRDGLEDDGIYVCLDVNCADDPADNEGPLAAMFYGFSVYYCMTTSLANDGEGLGTCGLPEAKLKELCEQAGFGEVRRIPLDDLFNSLYEVRP